MATYIGIKGVEIQTIAGDPANPIEGQVWYNTTANTMKGYVLTFGTGAWTSGGVTSSIHSHNGGAAGTNTAAIIATGIPPANPVPLSAAEEYNGTGWTTVNNCNSSSNQLGSTGAGTTSSMLMFGGETSPKKSSESYNGTTWTITNLMNEDHPMVCGAGTSSEAAIGCGSSPKNKNSESWNGVSWTATSPTNIDSIQRAGAGTATACFAITGDNAPKQQVEEWNGSAWSTGTAVTTGGEGMGAAGTVAQCIKFGGVPNHAQTEQWNGTSWTEVADLATGRDYVGYCGATVSNGLCIGGTTGPTGNSTATEEWAMPTPLATKTFTSS